jgi:DNA-directed RNA polymerase subunit RPC12/RpoP
MSLPKYECRMTGLRCNNCGHQFEDFAWDEAIQTSGQGVIGWNIASGSAFAGVNCPNCGSKLIGARHR